MQQITRTSRCAVEVCERAFDGLAIDICPVHESYFRFDSKKRLAGFVVPAREEGNQPAERKSPQIPGCFGAFMNAR